MRSTRHLGARSTWQRACAVMKDMGKGTHLHKCEEERSEGLRTLRRIALDEDREVGQRHGSRVNLRLEVAQKVGGGEQQHAVLALLAC